VLEAFAVSYGRVYPYLPLIDLLNGYFGIVREDAEPQRRDKRPVTRLIAAVVGHESRSMPDEKA
jgi:hypothetical protein